MLKHKYHWPVITIGTDFEAVKHAYKNNAHLIFNTVPNIEPYRYVTRDPELEGLGISFPVLEEECWASLNYGLSMRGMHPFGNTVAGLRVEPGNRLKIYTVNEKVFEVTFDSLNLFSLENVRGLPPCFKEEIDYCLLYDWFDVKSGMVHTHALIKDNSEFIKEIHFYLSRRIDGNKNKKDLTAVSKIKYNLLNDVAYSPAMARLKVMSMMKQSGINRVDMDFWKRDVFLIKKPKHIEDNNIVYQSALHK